MFIIVGPDQKRGSSMIKNRGTRGLLLKTSTTKGGKKYDGGRMPSLCGRGKTEKGGEGMLVYLSRPLARKKAPPDQGDSKGPSVWKVIL